MNREIIRIKEIMFREAHTIYKKANSLGSGVKDYDKLLNEYYLIARLYDNLFDENLCRKIMLLKK